MDITEALATASQQLKDLFADKDSLKGYHDWDRFLGAVLLIDQVIMALQQEPPEGTQEEAEG